MLLDIECFFPFVEWIHHHHHKDEADLEKVKWIKRLLQHLTIFHHHLSFGFNRNLSFFDIIFDIWYLFLNSANST